MTRQRICPEMHALAKMAEMAINPQNRQTVDKNTNEMAKGPFGKWPFLGKMAYFAKIASLQGATFGFQFKWSEAGDF